MGEETKKLGFKKKSVEMDLMAKAWKSVKRHGRQREKLLNEDRSQSSQEKHVELN